jgi:hypothetical protein
MREKVMNGIEKKPYCPDKQIAIVAGGRSSLYSGH